jgi:hypothetical protein
MGGGRVGEGMGQDLEEMLCEAAKSQLADKYTAAISKLIAPSGAKFALVLSFDCSHGDSRFTIGNATRAETIELLTFAAMHATAEAPERVSCEDLEAKSLDPTRYRDA